VRPSSPSGKGLGEECKHRQNIQKTDGGEQREKGKEKKNNKKNGQR
jgi:hypothetical protein